MVYRLETPPGSEVPGSIFGVIMNTDKGYIENLRIMAEQSGIIIKHWDGYCLDGQWFCGDLEKYFEQFNCFPKFLVGSIMAIKSICEWLSGENQDNFTYVKARRDEEANKSFLDFTIPDAFTMEIISTNKIYNEFFLTDGNKHVLRHYNFSR